MNQNLKPNPKPSQGPQPLTNPSRSRSLEPSQSPQPRTNPSPRPNPNRSRSPQPCMNRNHQRSTKPPLRARKNLPRAESTDRLTEETSAVTRGWPSEQTGSDERANPGTTPEFAAPYFSFSNST